MAYLATSTSITRTSAVCPCLSPSASITVPPCTDCPTSIWTVSVTYSYSKCADYVGVSKWTELIYMVESRYRLSGTTFLWYLGAPDFWWPLETSYEFWFRWSRTRPGWPHWSSAFQPLGSFGSWRVNPLARGLLKIWRVLASAAEALSHFTLHPTPLLRSLFAILDRTNFASHLPSSTSL